MNTETIVQKIAADHGLRRRGKLYAGPCPFCGGSNKSDKFNIRPDGGYICRGCGETGDVITWLRKQESLSCPDAHDRAGRECRTSSTCQAASKCRYGDKTARQPNRGRNMYRKPARPYQHPQDDDRLVPVIEPEYPKSIWLSWADEFVAKAHTRLLQNETELAYLAGRGIDEKMVDRLCLGWIPHQYQIPRGKIGLQVEQGEKSTLWVPSGLLIPIYDNGGALHRIRVRRPLLEREKFLKDLKYLWLKGSGNLPMVILPDGEPRGAVIVEAELDAIAIAAAHFDVIAIAVGTLHGGTGLEIKKILQDIPVILVALDAEAKSKPAVDAWKRTFRHAKFWPTPQAKDAGDFFKRGGDLAAWIEGGLPPKASTTPVLPPVISGPPEPLKQDSAFSPVRKQNGGEGEEHNITTGSKAEYVEVTLSNGKVIYLVDTKNEVWDRMAAEGKPVFTRHELEKLKRATATMTAEQRIKAAMAAIEAKEVFGGYISRGESFETESNGPGRGEAA